MKSYKSGEHFLSEIYPNLQHEEIVNNHTIKSDTKEDKIRKYLNRLENAHDTSNEHKIKLLKELYYQKYIIKELPQSYIELQERIYKEQGYGNITIDDKMKQELLKVVQKDQKDSLDLWIDYLMSDDAMYPTWFKYYVFNGMITLGKYDKENNRFQKRDEKTVEKFLEINREVIANVYDAISKEIGKNEITEDVKQALEQGESFKKLYLHFLRNNKKINYTSNEGIWKKYKKGTDSKILCDSLQGKNTGWCTAGYETAAKQLKQGDFYIYYTKDEIGEYRNPRIAIRMENNKIAEVRGIAKEQNLEPEMIEVAEQKLNEFPDKKEYLKKVNDMKLLTKIDNKMKQGLELTAEELRFLYELDGEITGFGYCEDPRLKQIRNIRSMRKDLSIIFNCEEELIGIEHKDKFVGGKYKVWHGNILMHENFLEMNIIFPETITGSLKLPLLKDCSGITFPKEIMRNLELDNLTELKNLILPEKIGGSLDLSKVENIVNTNFPKKIVGSLLLWHLKNAQSLILPEEIGGSLCLDELESFNGLVFPKRIEETLDLSGLISANGLLLPEEVNGKLKLSRLTSAKGLVLPKKVGDIRLDSLTTVDNLEFPLKTGSIFLYSLKNAKGITFPKEIEGDLILNNLLSTEGLVLPEKVTRDVNLNNLNVADKLILPKFIGGCINLSNLREFERLVFPEEVLGLSLTNLKSAKNINFPKKIYYYLGLDSLIDTDGLNLPKEIEGDLYLTSLENAKNLVLPKIIKGDLKLDGLKVIEDAILPEEIGGILYMPSLQSSNGLVLPKKVSKSIWLKNLPIDEQLLLPENLKNTIINTSAPFEYIPDEEYYNRNTKTK